MTVGFLGTLFSTLGSSFLRKFPSGSGTQVKPCLSFITKGGLGIGLHAVLYLVMVSGCMPLPSPTPPRISLKTLRV